MDHRRFLKHFLPNQLVVKAYLLGAVRDRQEAEDVFQEVSSVLWEKFETYEEGRPFRAWALGIAHLEVLKWRQKKARSRETISAETLELLASSAERVAGELDRRGGHLPGCLELLKGMTRQIVQMRYSEALPIADIARKLSKNVAAVEMALVRARRSLRDCVESKLGRVSEAGS